MPRRLPLPQPQPLQLARHQVPQTAPMEEEEDLRPLTVDAIALQQRRNAPHRRRTRSLATVDIVRSAKREADLKATIAEAQEAQSLATPAPSSPSTLTAAIVSPSTNATAIVSLPITAAPNTQSPKRIAVAVTIASLNTAATGSPRRNVVEDPVLQEATHQTAAATTANPSTAATTPPRESTKRAVHPRSADSKRRADPPSASTSVNVPHHVTPIVDLKRSLATAKSQSHMTHAQTAAHHITLALRIHAPHILPTTLTRPASTRGPRRYAITLHPPTRDAIALRNHTERADLSRPEVEEEEEEANPATEKESHQRRVARRERNPSADQEAQALAEVVDRAKEAGDGTGAITPASHATLTIAMIIGATATATTTPPTTIGTAITPTNMPGIVTTIGTGNGTMTATTTTIATIAATATTTAGGSMTATVTAGTGDHSEVPKFKNLLKK